MSDFLEAVTSAFHEMICQGDIRVESNHYAPNAFGNAGVVLVGRGFHVRLSRDRGDVSADIAASGSPEDWSPLERVLTSVGAEQVPEEGLLTPTEAADLVRKNLTLLEAGFSPSQLIHTRRRIENLRRWRLAVALKHFRQQRDLKEKEIASHGARMAKPARSDDLGITRTEDLVSDYRQAAARHGHAIGPDVANEAADSLLRIYGELRDRGQRDALLPLLTDSDPAVRGWAGRHALEFAPEQGVAVLEALAAGSPSLIRFGAQVTLREWRAGRLR